ncbi:MFS transporter [soil metagenome]
MTQDLRIRQARRATVGSFLGTTVEFYDFSLYATASALVFPAVFFAGIPTTVGVVLSYVTLAAGYVARPIGGIAFGHFGDRLGRKRMLLITMFIMGGASMAIGLVPSSAQIGVIAPILLVTLRVVQGIGLGGETGGANLMAMEHSSGNRRGLIGSIVASGGPSGSVFATLMFGLFSLLPPAVFQAWGWRIPFLLSAALVILALVLRSSVTESPEFLAARVRGEVTARVPLVDTLRTNWRSVVLLVLAVLAPFFLQSLMGTFALGFTVTAGNPQAAVLWLITAVNAITVFALILWASLSDRFGRRRVILVGYVVAAVAIWPIFVLLDSRSLALVFLAYLLANALAQSLMYAPVAALMAEMFPTRNRYTGVSLSFQFGATLGAGFAPLIAAALLTAAHGSTVLVTGLVSLLCAVGFASVIAARGIHRRYGATT